MVSLNGGLILTCGKSCATLTVLPHPFSLPCCCFLVVRVRIFLEAEYIVYLPMRGLFETVTGAIGTGIVRPVDTMGARLGSTPPMRTNHRLLICFGHFQYRLSSLVSDFDLDNYLYAHCVADMTSEDRTQRLGAPEVLYGKVIPPMTICNSLGSAGTHSSLELGCTE